MGNYDGEGNRRMLKDGVRYPFVRGLQETKGVVSVVCEAMNDLVNSSKHSRRTPRPCSSSVDLQLFGQACGELR